MRSLDLDAVRKYVNENIGVFHQGRIDSLQNLDINRLLIEMNPYLFRAKNMLTAAEIVDAFMDAFLSSSDDERFGEFLEGLAVFVAQQTTGGYKSEQEGVDMEFVNRGVHYVVQMKFGPNWGNSSQQNRLQSDLTAAVNRVKGQKPGVDVRAVLGICYGKTRTNFLRGYWKLVGQNFWHFISENDRLYIDIIEPIGYRAWEHNEEYRLNKVAVANRIAMGFLNEFCHPSGAIDWDKLVEATCGNYDLDRFEL